MAEPSGAPRPRSFQELLGRLQSLSTAERTLFAIGLMAPAILLFAALMNVSSGWPFLPGEASPRSTKIIGGLALVLLVPWAALFLAAMRARASAPDATFLAHATAQLYAITAVLYTWVTGPFDSPGWTLFLGGAVVGELLFPRLAVRFAVVTYFLLVFAGAFAISEGVGASILAGTAVEPLDTATILREGLLSLAYSTFTLVICASIIQHWRAREARYAELSRTDALTGLANRRRFLEVCQAEMTRARRYGRGLAVVLVDLDHFKRINDTRGHLAGDRVLAATARQLAAAVRDVDTAARWGGEEFALLLPQTDAAGALEVAQRFQRLIAGAPVDVGQGPSIVVTASLGVAALADPAMASIEDLLRRADEALYEAKASGRNRVVLAGGSEAAPPVTAAPDDPTGPVLH